MHSNVTVSMECPDDTPYVAPRNVIEMSKRQIAQNTPASDNGFITLTT